MLYCSADQAARRRRNKTYRLALPKANSLHDHVIKPEHMCDLSLPYLQYLLLSTQYNGIVHITPLNMMWVTANL